MTVGNNSLPCTHKATLTAQIDIILTNQNYGSILTINKAFGNIAQTYFSIDTQCVNGPLPVTDRQKIRGGHGLTIIQQT